MGDHSIHGEPLSSHGATVSIFIGSDATANTETGAIWFGGAGSLLFPEDVRQRLDAANGLIAEATEIRDAALLAFEDMEMGA